MANLESRLAKIDQERERILEEIEKRNKRKKIKCACCDDFYTIEKLTVIQTHWYTPPSGCTDGDYWNQGELQFVCPVTEIRNRLLFNNYDVPWKEREKCENNPEKQFKINYKSLFKEVIDSYDERQSGKSVNNVYVDENRKKFGLVEKRKLND